MRHSTTFRRLVVVVGLEGAKQLVLTFGGREIKVPTTESGSMFAQLVECLGIDGARAMAAEFGADDLYIPVDDSGIEAKNAAIVLAAKAGESHRSIAGRMGVSQRWVRLLCNRASDQKAQGDDPQSAHPQLDLFS